MNGKNATLIGALAALLFGAFVGRSGYAKADEPADDLKKMQGVWRLESVTRYEKGARRGQGDQGDLGIKVLFRNKTMTRSDDPDRYAAPIELDSATAPKQIKVIDSDENSTTKKKGPSKREVIGIYKFEKDRLVICLPGIFTQTGPPKSFPKAGTPASETVEVYVWTKTRDKVLPKPNPKDRPSIPKKGAPPSAKKSKTVQSDDE